MKPVIEIHPIQAKVLKVLLFQTEARFKELNPDKISTDHLNFHLKALIDAGIIQKFSSGKYALTPRGKEFANRFDTERVVIEKQAKLTLGIMAVKKENGKKYYLIHQRLKQPYFGYYGSVNGKIRWGEKVLDAAKREFFEETGLQALKMTLVGIYHKSDFSPEGELLEDKYFFRVRIDKFSGKLKEKVPEGRNYWFTKKEIFHLDNLFADMKEGLPYYDQNNLKFAERDFIAHGF